MNQTLTLVPHSLEFVLTVVQQGRQMDSFVVIVYKI